MREMGVEPFAYSFAPTHSSSAFAAAFASVENGAEDECAEVALAGRILTRRIFGKLMFFTLQVSRVSFQHTFGLP